MSFAWLTKPKTRTAGIHLKARSGTESAGTRTVETALGSDIAGSTAETKPMFGRCGFATGFEAADLPPTIPTENRPAMMPRHYSNRPLQEEMLPVRAQNEAVASPTRETGTTTATDRGRHDDEEQEEFSLWGNPLRK